MPFSKDGWDWPFIIYVGTVWLNRTEEETMRMTPRKLQALLKVHYYIEKQKMGSGKHKGKDNVASGFIDKIPGW